MTISEAARRLGLSRNTVALQVRLGIISTTKDERGWNIITDDEVARYAKEHQRKAKAPSDAWDEMYRKESQAARDAILKRVNRKTGE